MKHPVELALANYDLPL